jgi:hypothetical protein
MNESNGNHQTEPVKLPLRKTCLENMRAAGIAHGQIYLADFFAKELRSEPGTMRFKMDVSWIRQQLLDDGFYLEGRRQNGNFLIVPADANRRHGAAYSRNSSKLLKRGYTLLTNTDVSLLSEKDRKLHDAEQEKIATRFALNRRSKQVYNELTKTKPKLLQ